MDEERHEAQLSQGCGTALYVEISTHGQDQRALPTGRSVGVLRTVYAGNKTEPAVQSVQSIIPVPTECFMVLTSLKSQQRAQHRNREAVMLWPAHSFRRQVSKHFRGVTPRTACNGSHRT